MEEEQELKEAIREIRFCIQVLKDTPLNNSISRDTIKGYINRLSKEEEDLEMYYYETYGEGGNLENANDS